MRCLLLFFIIFFCIEGFVFSQDPQFSQFYATPLYLNPAFTGNTIQGRFAGIYRKQWPKVPGAFISQGFSYDHNFRSANSGIGVVFINDKAGSGGLRYRNFGMSYSYGLNITRKHTVRFGIRAARVTRDIDFSSLVFGDQLVTGSETTSHTFTYSKASDLDFSSGLIFFTKKYWIGTSFDHLNRPFQSLINQDTKLPIKGSLHGGYVFPVQKNAKKALSTLTLSANYKFQEKWDQLDMGAYFTIEPLVFGIWYRGIPFLKSYKPGYPNNDAVIAMLGIKLNDMLHVGYSYDYTISRLANNNSGGSHEISLIYEYATKQKKLSHKKNFIVPCSKF
jgi:type IX secretion system PorP/SprF family membrane protein